MSAQTWAVVAVLVAGLFFVARLLGGRRVAPYVVKQKIEAGAKVVDVRTPDEFRSGAYPGAVNIPLAELPRRWGEIPKDRPVVVYCASGVRSASAARLLAQAGFADVINAGGLRDMPA